MDKPDKLEIFGNYARYQPEARVTLQQAAAIIGEAISFCYEHKIPKLLMDGSKLTGHTAEEATLFERYWIVQDWAERSRGFVMVALVLRGEMIEPDGFSVTIAHNAGLQGDIFRTADEALEFLQQHKLAAKR